MLQPLLIFIILALLVSINFVTGGTLRSKSGSERNSWITEDAITEDESTDYEEELTLSDLFSDNDFEFVGDMIIEKKNVEVESSEEEGVQKSVVKNMSRIWPNNQVPIKFHSSLGRKARKSIQSAVNILEDATCISFPKYNPNRHKNYVIIKSIKKACKSTVGYVDKPGRNIINLESKTHCEEPNTVIHEIMHCLGVSHEQMRYDRDEYIEVLYDNLEPKAVSQYAKQSRKDLETYGEPYDYGSIMHYQVHAGSKNGQPAFRVLRQYDEAYIGNARIPSLIDLSKLNKLYGCPQPETVDSSSGEINDPRPQKRPPPHHVHDDDCTCEDS